MVYCDYRQHDENTVTYAYGGETSDISGLVRFDLDGKGFELVKEPEKSVVHTRSLMRLYGKYKSDFSKKNFGKKISYEC